MPHVYGERVLQRGAQGGDIEELQIRLAGFRGTVPDGDFGPGTEMQVAEFQRRFMQVQTPTGIVDLATYTAIDDFAARFPLDFSQLRCQCGVCGGFGQGKFKGKYHGNVKSERFHRFEYPGIHRMILWAARAVFLFFPEYTFRFSAGYRCSIHNEQHNRTTTNHHGKAVDIDIVSPDDSEREDKERCDRIRGRLVEWSNAQIGWSAQNRKALEPTDIAPTWIHYDVREYSPEKYLATRFFCTSPDQLDNRLPIHV